MVRRPKRWRQPFLYHLVPPRPGGGIRGYKSRLKKSRRLLSRAGEGIGINVVERLNLRDSATCEVIRGSPDALGLGGIIENKTIRGRVVNDPIIDYVDKGTHIE